MIRIELKADHVYEVFVEWRSIEIGYLCHDTFMGWRFEFGTSFADSGGLVCSAELRAIEDELDELNGVSN